MFLGGTKNPGFLGVKWPPPGKSPKTPKNRRKRPKNRCFRPKKRAFLTIFWRFTRFIFKNRGGHFTAKQGDLPQVTARDRKIQKNFSILPQATANFPKHFPNISKPNLSKLFQTSENFFQLFSTLFQTSENFFQLFSTLYQLFTNSSQLFSSIDPKCLSSSCSRFSID